MEDEEGFVFVEARDVIAVGNGKRKGRCRGTPKPSTRAR
jgi:hypothetical protein